MTDTSTRARLRLNGWSEAAIDRYIATYGEMTPHPGLENVMRTAEQRDEPGFVVRFPFKSSK